MMPAGQRSLRMPVAAALQVLIDWRLADQIVVTNQGSARIWPKLAEHPLDLHYNPSTMGGGGPARARSDPGTAAARGFRRLGRRGPPRRAWAAWLRWLPRARTNLTIVVLDNGLYEVTGGQQTPAARTAADLAAIAAAAGFPTAARFERLSDWQSQAAELLRQSGPRFICLAVEPTPPSYLIGPTRRWLPSLNG